MPCNCKNINLVADSDKITDMKKVILIQFKINAFKWKTLYKCKFCNALWEECYIEDRFGGTPKLTQVDNDYVKMEWGEKYI